ncbi:ABC transporter permease [Candidatus Woesearchaeota archaeon]|jgi:putative ABC transport system permease protein|nr:ABC transporter permease [Candidatus Woesearchaeota archaeon]MBT5271785.1 ABC transporter permease [Candidatus Woesearchaeota archaeon]MBT6041174.1 ABC transporter permease [Candidatus Woesearchaeota archaeon]MBT6336295.1 ABC transporter permease [Candidatus Woesearchaeota archaeon]MBT7927319.1 ABC transporter permease [Candidatus Woesearchaeota archaeon]
MILEYFKIAIKNLFNRKLRSLLTIIGIVIGIVAVVGLISVGQGMQNAINEQFQTVGQDRIVVTPGGEGFTGTSPVTSEYSTDRLFEHDLDVIKGVKGVYKATGATIEIGEVKFDNTIEYFSVFGVPTDSESLSLIKTIDFFLIEDGREFGNGETGKVIVGYKVALEGFDKEIRKGHRLKVKGDDFKVIALQKKTGSPIHDNMVRIPIDEARALFDRANDEFTTIFIKVGASEDPAVVAEDIKKAMRRDHGVKEGEEDFKVTTSVQLMEGFNNILNVVQIVLIGIAGISLFVGGIGIMNTMYTSVLQRRKEIGIMKSIGATNAAILMIFLFESGVLGIIGGVIGVIFGLMLSKGVELAASLAGVDLLKVYVSIPLVVSALIFSFLIGALSGFMPAKQASNLQPVDALRGL